MNYSISRHRRVRRVRLRPRVAAPRGDQGPDAGSAGGHSRTAPLPAAGSRRTRAGAVPSSTPSGTSWPKHHHGAGGRGCCAATRSGAATRIWTTASKLTEGRRSVCVLNRSRPAWSGRPNRSLLYALGNTDEELARPLIGVVSSYKRDRPRPHGAGQDRRGCKGRYPGRRRYAGDVSGHRRVRRHRHGPCGYESILW